MMTLNGPESQSGGVAQCFGIQYMEVDTAYRDNLLVFQIGQAPRNRLAGSPDELAHFFMSERKLHDASLSFRVPLVPLHKESGKLLRNRLGESDKANLVARSYLGFAEFPGGMNGHFLKSVQKTQEGLAVNDVYLDGL